MDSLDQFDSGRASLCRSAQQYCLLRLIQAEMIVCCLCCQSTHRLMRELCGRWHSATQMGGQAAHLTWRCCTCSSLTCSVYLPTASFDTRPSTWSQPTVQVEELNPRTWTTAHRWSSCLRIWWSFSTDVGSLNTPSEAPTMRETVSESIRTADDMRD